MIPMSTPSSRSWAARVCRKPWAWMRLARPARRPSVGSQRRTYPGVRCRPEAVEDRPCAAEAVAGAYVEPALQDCQRAAVHPNHTRLVALTVQHADRAAFDVNVLGVEIERLGDAKAGAIENYQQRTVAQ